LVWKYTIWQPCWGGRHWWLGANFSVDAKNSFKKLASGQLPQIKIIIAPTYVQMYQRACSFSGTNRLFGHCGIVAIKFRCQSEERGLEYAWKNIIKSGVEIFREGFMQSISKLWSVV
jgi:hypothetical protein